MTDTEQIKYRQKGFLWSTNLLLAYHYRRSYLSWRSSSNYNRLFFKDIWAQWFLFQEGYPQKLIQQILNFSFIKFAKDKVDFTDSSVTSSFLWGRSKSIYRDDFGVTLVRKTKESKIREVKFPSMPPPGYSKDTISWPLGDLIPDTLTGINPEELSSISKKLINENGYGGNAFAFMVLHKGIPVAEAYKPQFTKDTRFLSWSIAKSFVNGIVGVLVKEGGLDINKPTGLEEWKNDDRRNITLNDLMRMQSGLEWNEDYGNRSDVNGHASLQK